jgi:putative endonuclease
MTKKLLGAHYEEQALNYLKQKGCHLITKNFNCRMGEIDLICSDSMNLLFIEVRYRQKKAYGTALESVDFYKQKKIKKAAQYFLLEHLRFQNLFMRFDVVAIDDKEIKWIQGAFY